MGTERKPMVGMGVVGYGHWGTNLARNIVEADGAELRVIVDPDPDRREQAAKRYPHVTVIASAAECLAMDEVEAILIATPSGTHADLAIQALEAGRHVLVEKPLATDAKGATAVVESAERHGLTAMVGHTFLYSQPVRYLRRAMQEGDLGTIRYLAFQRRSLGRVRADCDALWNFAPHDISIAMYLLDEDMPKEVSATGFSFLRPGIADVAFGTLTYEDGYGVHLQVSWLDPVKTRLLTVVGSNKMAVYDDVSTDRVVALYDSGVVTPETGMGEFRSMADFQWRTRAGDVTYPRIDLREPLLTEVEHFAVACRDGSAVRTDAKHGLRVVKILEALSASMAQNGAPVLLP